MSEAVHNPGSVKIKTGFKVTIPSGSPAFSERANQWKHGVPFEVYNWLTTVVGVTVGHNKWELDGEGDWVHTGTEQIPNASKKKKNLRLNFWFRDTRKAALFVIRWDGQL